MVVVGATCFHSPLYTGGLRMEGRGGRRAGVEGFGDEGDGQGVVAARCMSKSSLVTIIDRYICVLDRMIVFEA